MCSSEPTAILTPSPLIHNRLFMTNARAAYDAPPQSQTLRMITLSAGNRPYIHQTRHLLTQVRPHFNSRSPPLHSSEVKEAIQPYPLAPRHPSSLETHRETDSIATSPLQTSLLISLQYITGPKETNQKKKTRSEPNQWHKMGPTPCQTKNKSISSNFHRRMNAPMPHTYLGER